MKVGDLLTDPIKRNVLEVVLGNRGRDYREPRNFEEDEQRRNQSSNLSN